MKVLSTWTTTALADLPAPARTLAQLLACLEDTDRDSWVLGYVWLLLWREWRDGDAPPFEDALKPLLDGALVDVEPINPDDGNSVARYVLHTGVAESIRDAIDTDLRGTVDDLLGRFWCTVFRDAEEREKAPDDRAAGQ
jgi:hypothetical protein